MSTITETVELTDVSNAGTPSFSPWQTPGQTSHSDHSQSSNTSMNIPHMPPTNEPTISLAQNTISISKARLVLTVLLPSLVNFFSGFTNGIITVGLPVIARSVDLPRALYLWPASVLGLTSGAMLLIAGAVADIVGAKEVELVGVFLLGAVNLACGLSTTGIQLVIFRALQGIATALHLPSSVSLIATAVPPGKARNVGFAALGTCQAMGFSFGIVIGGIMVDKVGWRSGFYLCGGVLLVGSVAGYWILPNVKTVAKERGGSVWGRLKSEVDWVGGVLSSGGLAIFAYVLAVLSADLSSIKSAETASLLAVSLALLVAFPFWMHFQEKAGRPALIPNSLWRSTPFTATCIMVALAWAVVNSMENFSSLYFQEVQKASTLTTSLYLLPQLVSGVVINAGMSLLVDRIPARWLVTASTLLCALAPLMMALTNPAWSYWYVEFWAQIFGPFSADVLFTVGLIIVSDSFPEKTQALAGAVFNTVGQFGMSIGVGICQVVALGVMGNESTGGDGEAFANVDQGRVLKGYRASFWTMLAYIMVGSVVGVVGLRKAGKVGLKRE